MKKVISLAVLVLACALYSCSGDGSGVSSAGGRNVVNDDIGGQTGQIPTPPPPRQAPKDLSGQKS
ncbi:MAG TPA: hypothetical protein VK476_07415 [Flavobacterium sp.]|nr:hypothetical protein [Flavobacterium sp.]